MRNVRNKTQDIMSWINMPTRTDTTTGCYKHKNMGWHKL